MALLRELEMEDKDTLDLRIAPTTPIKEFVHLQLWGTLGLGSRRRARASRRQNSIIFLKPSVKKTASFFKTHLCKKNSIIFLLLILAVITSHT